MWIEVGERIVVEEVRKVRVLKMSLTEDVEGSISKERDVVVHNVAPSDGHDGRISSERNGVRGEALYEIHVRFPSIIENA